MSFGEIAPVCVHELVQRMAALHPRAPALRLGAERVDYGTLNARANRLARALVARGVQPDLPVGLCVPRSPELIVAALAILKAGGAYVPLDPAYPRARLDFMLADAHVGLLLTTRELAPQFAAHGRELFAVDGPEGFESLAADDIAPASIGLTPRNLAYFIYTSGSTGTPKASLLEHRGLVNLAAEQLRLFAAGPGSRVLQFSSMSFDAATFEWVMALTSGAELCLAAEGTIRAPGALDALVREQAITHATLPPVLLPMLERESWRTVHTLIVAGEACARESAERWSVGRRFFNAYGPSEMTVWSTTGSFVPGQERVHIGTPIANTACYVLDDTGREVDVGGEGELYLGGVGIARGYLDRNALTAEKFPANPVDPARFARVFRSGDRVRRLADGNLEFLGRVDRQLKLRGLRIEPGEIESALREHAAVRDAHVRVLDAPGPARLIAYVSVDPAASAAATDAQVGAAVDPWRHVFDDSYAQATESLPFEDFSHWNSSFTRAPIPPASLRDWRDATVARIRAFAPRQLLEVGCGSGLLLGKLAADCEHYVACDLSPEVIARLRRNLPVLGAAAARVELFVAAAHELDNLASRRFDTIVLNSVVQYFRDAAYLELVIARLVALLAPGGRIFIGDVRHQGWNEDLHRAIDEFQAPGLDAATREHNVRRRLLADRELAIAPEYFLARVAEHHSLGGAELRPKLGHEANEMHDWRYDVVLHHRDALLGDQRGWRELSWSCESASTLLERLRAARPEVEPVRVRGIANPRLGATGIDPSEWRALAATLDCDCEVALELGARSRSYQVLLWRGARPTRDIAVLHADAWQRGETSLCNDPAARATRRLLEDALATHLRTRLPASMLPAAIVALDEFPLTPNGKLDAARLPAPDARAASAEFLAPRDALEQSLCDLWSRSLAVAQIGVRDNFYELGGDSLAAVRMAAAVRETHAGVELALADLREAPTIEALAARVRMQLARQALAAAPRAAGVAAREVLRL